MSGDARTTFLSGLHPTARTTAERLILVIDDHAGFDAAIKWRQLTFAVESDFDHWVCAVVGTATRARLAFHFGAWLDDTTGAFDASDAEFVRRITYRSVDEVDDAVVRDLLAQAVDALPAFRARRRGPARPDPRRS